MIHLKPIIWRFSFVLLFVASALTPSLTTHLSGQDALPCTPLRGTSEAVVTTDGPAEVYVIPVHGQIGSAQLYILRRGLKAAVEKGIDAVMIDIDTPGGELNTTLEMMKVLDRFNGETLTFVSNEAISAGVYISASTQDIYFAPKSVIGSAAVIQGTGQEIPETMKQKIDSYLMARVRSYTEDHPYRSKVVQAMMDEDYVLEIDGEVIKPEGSLLSLTALEATKEYGQPPRPLLGVGIYDDVESVLASRYGEEGYVIKKFEITWSEQFAKYMNVIAPLLMGLGLLGLFIEFKTPGFGVFGIAGISLLGIVFLSNYVAGLAGHEEILIFLLGVGLILLEIFLLPGVVVLAATGAFLVFGSLIWALADYWPGNMGDTPIPVLTLVCLISPSTLLSIQQGVLCRLGSCCRCCVRCALSSSNATWWAHDITTMCWWFRSHCDCRRNSEQPRHRISPLGTLGEAVTDLFPSGEVSINSKRYQARVEVGSIREVVACVSGIEDFSLVVEAAKS